MDFCEHFQYAWTQVTLWLRKKLFFSQCEHHQNYASIDLLQALGCKKFSTGESAQFECYQTI